MQVALTVANIVAALICAYCAIHAAELSAEMQSAGRYGYARNYRWTTWALLALVAVFVRLA